MHQIIIWSVQHTSTISVRVITPLHRKSFMPLRTSLSIQGEATTTPFLSLFRLGWKASENELASQSTKLEAAVSATFSFARIHKRHSYIPSITIYQQNLSGSRRHWLHIVGRFFGIGPLVVEQTRAYSRETSRRTWKWDRFIRSSRGLSRCTTYNIVRS